MHKPIYKTAVPQQKMIKYSHTRHLGQFSLFHYWPPLNSMQNTRKNYQFWAILQKVHLWNKNSPKMAKISKNKNFPKNSIWGSLYHLMPSNLVQNIKKSLSNIQKNWLKMSNCSATFAQVRNAWAWPLRTNRLSFFLSSTSIYMQKIKDTYQSFPELSVIKKSFNLIGRMLYGPKSREQEFFRIKGFRRKIANHKILYPIFAIFGHFFTKFGPIRVIPKKIQLCLFSAFMDP